MINGINGIANNNNYDVKKVESKNVETAIASLWGPVFDYLDNGGSLNFFKVA